jgi:hypothetical protein
MNTNRTDGIKTALLRGRHGYTLLLVSLMALWLFAPGFELVGLKDLGEVVLISVALVAATYVMLGKGVRFVIVVILGLTLGAMIWVNLHTPLPPGVIAVSSLIGASFFGAVALELLGDIISRKGRVTMPLIHGAIAVYLLIGVCFSFVFLAIYGFDPGSFKGLEDAGVSHNKFTYFSFVTLTTLGYGDVTPVSRMGESLATMEAVIGQLYLTVLVARLVGMQISQQPAR